MKAIELREHIDAFRIYNQSRGLAARTIESYDQRIRLFHRWFLDTYGGQEEITTRRIREFAAARLGNGSHPMTVRGQLEALRVLHRFLVEDEIIAHNQNPMRLIKCIKKKAPEIVPLTVEQIREFLGTFDPENLVDYRNYIICLLILDTGLRAGEALGLTLDAIDLEEGSLRVHGKGNKKRTVYMGEKMRDRLVDYLERCRPWLHSADSVLFPPAAPTRKHPTMTSKYLSIIVTRKFDQVGIPRMHSAAHRLRHTFAVMFMRNGGDAFSLQRLLGHADLEMTKRYVLLNQEDLRAAHRKASPVDSMEL